MLGINPIMAVANIFSIIILVGAILAVVVCFILLIRRISQRRRERD